MKKNLTKILTTALITGFVATQFQFAQATVRPIDEYAVDDYEYTAQTATNNQPEQTQAQKVNQILAQDNNPNTAENQNANNENVSTATNTANKINNIRFSKSSDKVRVVFDLNPDTQYSVVQQANGYIMVDFSQPISSAYANGIEVDDDVVPYIEIYSDDTTSCAVIQVTDNSAFSQGELQNPRRLFVDVDKNYEYSVTKEIEPGLTQINYYSKQNGVKETAYAVDVDPAYFKFVPVVGGGNVLAKNTVTAMSDYVNAGVAENASYFGSNRELFGVTKIAGELVSSMYLPRTAFGVLADGKPYIGEVTYSGIVHTDLGDAYVSGLNGTRTSDSVMLYNHYYGSSTGTDKTGMEYTVKNNKIVDINSGNSPIGKDTIVVSVTGASKNMFAGLKVGDTMEVEQILNQPWDTATDLLGVGPRLVKDGQVYITTDREQIGPDVTGARAPRTGVGILRSGHVLFAVVDGRQGHSTGMTLDEFAKFLIGMDVVDAVNFDGGGSSELVVGGKIVNSPSDGRERPVAAALTAVRR